jgi:hypothetical protein
VPRAMLMYFLHLSTRNSRKGRATVPLCAVELGKQSHSQCQWDVFGEVDLRAAGDEEGIFGSFTGAGCVAHQPSSVSYISNLEAKRRTSLS